MSGYVLLNQMPPPEHHCAPPDFFQRLQDRIDYGTIWACDCGVMWILHRGDAVNFWRQLPPTTSGHDE